MSDTAALVSEALRRLEELRAQAPVAANGSLVFDSLALALDTLGDIAEAMKREAADDAIQRLIRHLVPRWHFPMLNDDERNGAFEAAVVSLLGRHDTVLDIGAGSGVLALIAARAGAQRVFTCEQSRLIAEVARTVIDANGHGDVVKVLAKRSDEIEAAELGGRAQLIVSETFDCGLFGEALLSTMRHAREHLLAPGGTLVPAAAGITAMLVESDAIARLNRVDHARRFDVSAFNRFSTKGYFPVRIGSHPHRVLSERVRAVSVDFHHDDLLPSSTRHDFRITQDGLCHGIVFWFDVTLAPDARLENSPENPTSNWHQAVQLLPEPRPVAAGTTAVVTVSYDDSSIDFALTDTDHP